ncbi:hypothetical protein PROFUN_16167 [Planoprotostelium fungivorum]|uniref:Uncharacterized protein n=1 Tax=Planoprotostelium fungivorum TaxID=1890364 RepID=A0A2P6MS54_9EUKA|nr:hypothetical protein PROFUN_16167 [Planoprotostelium fungivorum]
MCKSDRFSTSPMMFGSQMCFCAESEVNKSTSILRGDLFSMCPILALLCSYPLDNDTINLRNAPYNTFARHLSVASRGPSLGLSKRVDHGRLLCLFLHVIVNPRLKMDYPSVVRCIHEISSAVEGCLTKGQPQNIIAGNGKSTQAFIPPMQRFLTTLLLLLSCTSQAHSFKCQGYNATGSAGFEDVDWWFIYKFPEGYEFLYYDSRMEADNVTDWKVSAIFQL